MLIDIALPKQYRKGEREDGNLAAFFFFGHQMELQMTTPPPDDTQHASTYLALLYDVAPLIIAAFLIGVFRGWAGIKRSYLHESFWWTLGNIVLSSAVMSALAVGLVLALPVFGHEIPPAGELGIVLLMSSMGMKGTDKLMEYLAKATRIDPSNRESLERVKSGMTLEQQHEHMDACPFYNACSERHCSKNCSKCPKGEHDA